MKMKILNTLSKLLKNERPLFYVDFKKAIVYITLFEKINVTSGRTEISK